MAQESSSSASFEIPTLKAKACTNCRRRKIKCDGERPKCGQCLRSSSFQDCEYPDDGPTRTQILEEQIAILEARIEELEKPKEFRSTLTLHNPYPGERRSASLPASRGGSSVHLPSPHLELPSSPSSTLSIQTPSEGISLVESENLIKHFLLHGSQFGFFLNVQNFREAALGRSGQRPAAVLLDVVHLLAIHLSGSAEYAAYEASYLSRALRTAVDALSGTHTINTVIHCIQAEVLLSHYFLRNTRFLEGKYHLSAAVSLVISSGLHRIRSADPHAVCGPLGPAFRALAPPRDAIDENERINAFWTVLTLNNCWTTADGSPSNISYTVPDARIDTPWPVDVNASFNQGLPDLSVGTVTTFLANLPDTGTSVAALHAKAAILFEQASRLASQYRPNMSNEQLNQFYVSFNSIDTLIEGFKRLLPTVHLESTREMFVVHSLVHVATIQLHNPFGVDIEASRLRELAAARAVVADIAQVPVNDFVYIDPIMGTLFMATCQVFMAELVQYRRHRSLHGPVPEEERSLMDEIETVLAVMNVFAPNCRLMDSQLNAMRQMYHEL
ncbi:Zn(2)-Cys(6) binuclear cluster domain-containing protein [Mycena galericulata]|nr:Zn(2)-Cys(6) binuclear cluster domain-containing protein [Mycena galericulata]